MNNPANFSCPIPQIDHDTVQLAHGGGGRLMRNLIEGMFLPTFGSAEAAPHDSAVLEVAGGRLAFTTDTFVIDPLVFPGGDIGKLAVCGTVNDLASAGARPRWLSAGFVLEEGLDMRLLRQIVESMQRTAAEAGVQIVTGDTKVVDRGKGDGVFINTSGVGVIPDGVEIAPHRVQTGDAVLVSGDLGRHGIAVMSVREGLTFESDLQSDCAPLHALVEALTTLGGQVHCLRDLTRGGLAAALIEMAEHASVGIELDEESIPVCDAVAGACELLGLDPLYVANEGRLMAIVAPEAAKQALAIMAEHPATHGPARIGTVVDRHAGSVELRSPLGVGRLIDLFSGEQMPRIC